MSSVETLPRDMNGAWIGNGGRLSMATLMNRHGTDKLFHHHYEDEYERHFAPFRDLPIRLLEIGVGGFKGIDCGGESLKVWRDYFSQAHIVGIDCEPKTLDFGPRVEIHQCDANDQAALRGLNEACGPFDIIIDDGSHFQEHVLNAFSQLWMLLNPGGIYVIEDMATAYWPEYGGDPEKPPVIYLLFACINAIHQRYWRPEPLKPAETDPATIKSVHVSREIAFITKMKG